MLDTFWGMFDFLLAGLYRLQTSQTPAFAITLTFHQDE